MCCAVQQLPLQRCGTSRSSGIILTCVIIRMRPHLWWLCSKFAAAAMVVHVQLCIAGAHLAFTWVLSQLALLHVWGRCEHRAELCSCRGKQRTQSTSARACNAAVIPLMHMVVVQQHMQQASSPRCAPNLVVLQS
jgi:hypothetical protein